MKNFIKILSITSFLTFSQIEIRAQLEVVQNQIKTIYLEENLGGKNKK